MGDCQGKERLCRAVEEEDEDTIRALAHRIGGVDFFQETSGNTPLTLAAMLGYRHICELLLELNASIDLPDQQGRTALYVAALGGHLETVKFLAAQGAHVNAVTSDSYTPLFAAAWRGHTAVVQYLHDQNANCKHVDDSGRLARDVAKEWDHAKVVELLDSFDQSSCGHHKPTADIDVVLI